MRENVSEITLLYSLAATIITHFWPMTARPYKPISQDMLAY